MLTCKLKAGQPCFLYQGKQDEARLNEFLRANGGSDCRIENGRAEMITIVKATNEQRTIYLLPGTWLRCFGQGQFTAVPGHVFQKEYELV